jgi:hypothetical protein
MCRKNHVGSIIFSFVFVLLFIALSANTVSADESLINCQAHDGKCSMPIGQETVTLEIQPRPVTAMQDSTFTVTLTGIAPKQAPFIDLGMPAMKMGPNRVRLKPTGDGTYRGKGIIVRCKSGRRTWFANVVVPGVGEAKFVFDVIY